VIKSNICSKKLDLLSLSVSQQIYVKFEHSCEKIQNLYRVRLFWYDDLPYSINIHLPLSKQDHCQGEKIQ